LVTGIGKPNETNIKDESKVFSKLADFIKGFRRGVYPTVYLPFAHPLLGLGGLEELLNLSNSPEDAYHNVARLIEELKSFKHIVDKKSFEKCLVIAEELLGGEAIGFVERYLTINTNLFMDILDFLYIRGSVYGSIEAYESSVIVFSMRLPHLSSRLLEAYQRCMKAESSGGSKRSDREIRKRKYGISRFFDNILVIVGAAAHTPATLGQLKFGRGRHASYTLYATPFTRALRHVIDSTFRVESYIEGLKRFTEFTIQSFLEGRDPIGIVKPSLELLNRYKHIGVESSERAAYNTINALWNLLSNMKRRGFI